MKSLLENVGYEGVALYGCEKPGRWERGEMKKKLKLSEMWCCIRMLKIR